MLPITEEVSLRRFIIFLTEAEDGRRLSSWFGELGDHLLVSEKSCCVTVCESSGRTERCMMEQVETGWEKKPVYIVSLKINKTNK